MPDEPSLGELWRLVERVERGLSTRLDRVLTTDVWTAERREIERRLSEMERAQTRMRDQHEQDMAAIAARREQDGRDRAANRRWLIAAVVLPVVTLAVTVALTLQGGGGT